MSRPMKPDDPAYWMLFDEHTTTPVVHDEDCFICMDPEFAQMGLPLCRPCPLCGTDGHVPADDCICTVCDQDERWLMEQPEGELLARAVVRTLV